jgi:hypothetical protein
MGKHNEPQVGPVSPRPPNARERIESRSKEAGGGQLGGRGIGFGFLKRAVQLAKDGECGASDFARVSIVVRSAATGYAGQVRRPESNCRLVWRVRRNLSCNL